MATSFEDRAATDARAMDDPGQMELFLTGNLALPDLRKHHKTIAELLRPGPKKPRRPIILPFPDLGDSQLSWVPYPPENDESWSPADIEDFHWNVLVASVRSLTDGRASDEMREHVIKWIARPLVPESELPDYPLSFQASCVICGWDPESAQQHALDLFAQEKQPPRPRRT